LGTHFPPMQPTRKPHPRLLQSESAQSTFPSQSSSLLFSQSSLTGEQFGLQTFPWQVPAAPPAEHPVPLWLTAVHWLLPAAPLGQVRL
jgi:hypothetical protein